MGYDSQLVFEPKRTIWHLPLNKELIKGLELTKDDVVIIQKFKTRSTKRIIQELRNYPIKVGYIDCDEPIVPDIAHLADFTIVPSSFMQKRYEEHGVSAFCIEDSPEKFVDEAKTQSDNQPLKCVLFGNHSKSKWKEVTYFEQLLKKHNITDWQFETISNIDKATHRWNKDSFNKLTEYDLVVIPVPEMSLDYKIKSSNRLLQSIALRLPVLASPIPSYVDVVEDHGIFDDIICENETDWVEKLRYYSNSEVRKRVGGKNLDIAYSFDLDSIILNWISIMGLTQSKPRLLNFRIVSFIKRKAFSPFKAIKPPFFA